MSAEASSNPRVRYQLVRRVKQALSSLDGVAVISIDDEIPEQLRPGGHGDFVIQTLDLRLRVILFVGREPPANRTLDVASYERTIDVLSHSSDTDAVVSVFDDQDLTAFIVEPFDAFGEVLAPSGQPAPQTTSLGPAPLAAVMSEYLRLLQVEWQPWMGSSAANPLDIRQLSRDVSKLAVADRRARRVVVREKQIAQSSLADVDTRWIASIVEQAATGGISEDLEDEFRRRGQVS